MTNPEPRYLGDGVYAKYDGYHIVLTTGSHKDEDADNRICLEPGLIDSLVKYEDNVAEFLMNQAAKNFSNADLEEKLIDAKNDLLKDKNNQRKKDWFEILLNEKNNRKL